MEITVQFAQKKKQKNMGEEEYLVLLKTKTG